MPVRKLITWPTSALYRVKVTRYIDSRSNSSNKLDRFRIGDCRHVRVCGECGESVLDNVNNKTLCRQAQPSLSITLSSFSNMQL